MGSICVEILSTNLHWNHMINLIITGPASEVSVEVPARAEIAAIAIDEAGLLIGLLFNIIIMMRCYHDDELYLPFPLMGLPSL